MNEYEQILHFLRSKADHRVRLDAGESALVARQLLAVKSRTYDVKYPGLKAREYILKELMHCTEKAHYQKLKAFMTSTGGAYLDPRVTIEVNNAYAKQFPAKPAAKAA